MHRATDDIWISFGVRDQHTLYHAVVRADEPGGLLCVFHMGQEPRPGLLDTPATDAAAYFDSVDGFQQQPVIVSSVPTEIGGVHVRVEAAGIAVAAEDRITERFGMAVTGCTALIGVDDRCPVTDVSMIGFSVVSDTVYDLGQVVDVSFEHNGEAYFGLCRVKSVKGVGDGARYGLLSLSGPSGGSLDDGLRALTDEARRARTRRRAG